MNKTALVIATLFVVSGATSLVYQVCWMRMLSLFFGSDIYAAAITLSAFMGGLSIGSFLASRIGDNIRRPLIIYGICELLIAIFAFAFPHILTAFHDSYQTVYREYFASIPWLYQAFRLGTSVVALIGPTVLMGATLPLIVRQFAERPEILGRRAGRFYAANTVGALIGTLATGFIALPALGVSTTLMATQGINLTIGCIAIVAGLRTAPVPIAMKQISGVVLRLDRRQWSIIAIMFFSGMAALALEVVWMRILVQSFSATVYAFTIMLASFLFGIFYGSRLAAESIDEQTNPLRRLGTLQIWLGGGVALLAVFSYLVPGIFGALVWGLTQIGGGAFGTASIIAQVVVAMALITIPTILLGATFPTAVKAFTYDIEARANGTGVIYAANTAGALLGGLLGGFILLPMFGARNSLVVIAALFSITGLFAVAGDRRRLGPEFMAGAVTMVVASVITILLPQQIVVNFNMQRSTAPKSYYHGEGNSHTIDIVKGDLDQTIMMIDGNIEADNTLIQRKHFILKGDLPLLLKPEAREVAVIGLGLGITLKATERNSSVNSIRVIELSRDMVRAHRVVPEISGNLLDSPKLRVTVDDGRIFFIDDRRNF